MQSMTTTPVATHGYPEEMLDATVTLQYIPELNSIVVVDP